MTTLPAMLPGDRKTFESKLEGTNRLLVVKAIDISKPAEKPIDDIDEPDEEEVAQQNRLNKSNARMIQLDLKDSNDASIKAIETERIELLTDIKPDSVITITGPVDVRCGNIMLEKRHVSGIEVGPKVEPSCQIVKEVKPEVIDCAEDWDEEEEDDCIILN